MRPKTIGDADEHCCFVIDGRLGEDMSEKASPSNDDVDDDDTSSSAAAKKNDERWNILLLSTPSEV
jgi:hypothetical protein